jgi:hypothetical protein
MQMLKKDKRLIIIIVISNQNKVKIIRLIEP